MRIRCERCATTYELDERRLPPHGALVKCTRCDHVFRAAPPPASEADPAGGPEAGPAGPPASEERTALFGFPSPAGEENTAPIAARRPEALVTPASKEGASRPVAQRSSPATASRPAKSPAWIWIVVAALVAATLLGGWWWSQRKAATPTTRLPAGAETFPT